MSFNSVTTLLYAFFVWSTLVGFNILSGELDVTDLGETGQGNVIKQLSFVVIFIFVVVRALQLNKISRSLIQSKQVIGLGVLFIFCLFTISYSYVPDVSIRRLIVTFIVLISMLLFTFIYGVSYILNITSIVIFSLVGISVMACVFVPEAVHSADAIDQQLIGSWKGIFTHKNVAGAVSAISVILLFYGYGFGSKKLNRYLALVSLFFLFQTASKTSISLVFVVLLFSHNRLINFVSNKLHYVFAGLLLCSPLIYQAIDYFYLLIDDPESFTGRSSIWKILLDIIYDNPVTGAGFQSLYHVGPYSKLTDYAGDWVQYVAHGHNGYIDLAAQIGLLGVLAFTVVILMPIFSYIRVTSLNHTKESICVFSIFAFFLAHNFTESSFLDTTRVGWFFLSLCFSIALKEKLNVS